MLCPIHVQAVVGQVSMILETVKMVYGETVQNVMDWENYMTSKRETLIRELRGMIDMQNRLVKQLEALAIDIADIEEELLQVTPTDVK